MRRFEYAFALPTVVITSVILLMLLVSALSSSTSVRRTLNEQYYESIARDASEAGIAYARNCINQNLSNGSSSGWGYGGATTLKTGMLCNGTYPSGVNCDSAPGADPDQCYVYYDASNTPGIRSSFTVDALQILDGAPYQVQVTATMKLYNSLNASYMTYPHSESVSVPLAQRPVTTGLVLNLDAADISSYSVGSSTWKDLSAYGNNGTLTGAVSYSASGGGALSFGGSGYIRIPNTASLQVTGSQTLDFWIYPTNLSTGRQNILDKAYGGEFSTTLEPTGYMTAYYGTSGTAASPYTGWNVPTVTSNKWQEVTIVRNLSTMAIWSYVNGNLVGGGTALYPSATASTNDVTLGLGYTGIYYNGLISSARIYNRALSNQEVRQNFTSMRDRYYSANQTSCLSILKAGLSTGSGIYTITPSGTPLSVYCDMTNDGGGWTLVLQNNSTVATPSPVWADAISSNTVSGTLGTNLASFDQLVGLNYWNYIGTQLRAQAGSSPTVISHKATYAFNINPMNFFSLQLSNEKILLGGTQPGLFTQHNGVPFTTTDNDHDTYATNCSALYGNHPWWYTSCWGGNFFAGGSGYQEAPYWAGSGSDYYASGSIWVR